ncbi:hydroxymethylglutaryl-CoA synthase 1 [Phlebotomus argentipes]|uniref:hydroxymethylglutaryl-CoA synthase 1 n=1 Tax=Phlebotomus argentipes TaxID=94469 RepID=UPI002892C605|nr:hydroxymethylglutaryl-CoA synthase 1 [Phlebotomus argentipes]
MAWPQNVGILGIELFFPSLYVDQTELEAFDGVSAGKYTIGLGQKRMGFCTDREDINSLCLTVVSNLLERHGIPPARIGRLEVGTETIIDKSKSVKSVLMQLFTPHGVTDLEGIDTTNACYGGTAALFNAVNWVESSSWNGRLALVVCGDIAVYAKGSARPTGGAGAVAMLVGPNAPLVLDRGLRAIYMKHAYDFYKPDLSSEYPTVDGKLSIQCYLNALDNCYQLYCEKARALQPNSPAVGLDAFDAVLFHTPFCKLVQKSLARIGVNDYFMTPPSRRLVRFPGFEKFEQLALEDTYFDKDVEKAFMSYYDDVFKAKTAKSLLIASQVGNMYTPSLYSGLISYLITGTAESLKGRKVALFSYGSGLASTLYSISVTNDVELLQPMLDKLSDVLPKLEKRQKVSPKEFSDILEIREQNNHKAPLEPSGAVDRLFPGTFFLKSIDQMHRRQYDRVPK